MSEEIRIVSIQVGRPREHPPLEPDQAPWRTGFVKEPVAGPVWLSRTNLAGDGQADRRVHGGPDKAVNSYPAGHYPGWRAELALPNLTWGAFAENFTIEGLDESIACVGDVYGIGAVVVQISQPRQPCRNVARRWRLPELPARMIETDRTGWYLRVLAEGYVEAGAALRLAERPHPEWKIGRANDVMYGRDRYPESIAALAACPDLSDAWREALRRRLG